MTNVVEFGDRTAIEHQARKWLIRMDGDDPLTRSEKEALKEWMSRSAFHAGELTRLTRQWHRANSLTDLLAGLESQRRSRKSRLAASWIWTVLMSVGALTCSNRSRLRHRPQHRVSHPS